MEIKSRYQLQKTLSKDMAWRRHELTEIKLSVKAVQGQGRSTFTPVRAALTLLYAHWEGVVKNSALFYLEFVRGQGFSCHQVAPHFLALAIKKRLSDESQKARRTEAYIRVADFFLTGLQARLEIDVEGAIDTESNLNSDVLRNSITQLGLDYAPFETKELLINKELLGHRNPISHGEYRMVDAMTYLELHDAVIQLLVEFQNQIIDAASNETHLRPS
ncbi:MAG: MAE_28990/MAE_18760 family HEPN-like nuclease [Thermodesulfobacteriota bacterium]